MTGDVDRDLAVLMRDAAARYQPAADLRARVERRSARRRRRARVLASAGLATVVLVAWIALASDRRDRVDVRVGSSPDATSDVHPIDWSTPLVRFEAKELRIEVGGRTFLGDDPRAVVENDPGRVNEYMTLERTWQEHGVEMRVNIYFVSDGADWWSDEIRTYDGARDDPEWVTYTGEFFRTPLDQAFSGDLELPRAAEAQDGGGRFLVRGLQLQAFVPPEACSAPSGPYVVEVLYPEIQLGVGGGFGANVRLRDERCDPVTDLSGFRFVFTPDDPSVLRAEPGCVGLPDVPECEARTDLVGLAAGQTTLEVTVHQRHDDAVVASGTMRVSVAQG
jgi:hypothetical protein